ncbi:MAG TPA: hypothetical protein VGW57_04475 [Chthoniobacterales bacterium]|nr:hypothetical protein [Chthoniobacterales bacterium]
MRRLLIPLVIATVVQIFAATPPASGRTVLEIPNFPLQALRSGVGKKLYSSLAISPVSAWVMARATVLNGHTGGAQIIHSEGNGAYDKALLAIANDYTVTGGNMTETRLAKDTLNVHLLIYDLKDGKMAVCFSHNDDARYNGVGQIGTAWVGILQGGKWVTISGTYPRKWGGRRGSE